MKNLTKRIYILSVVGGFLLLAGCSNNAKTAAEPEITKMDSVSKDLESTTKELDEQAKKVEASLEKIDKELKTSQKKS